MIEMMDAKAIFAKNLNAYMEKRGKTQADLITDLGINKSTISTWCNGVKMPRMGAIQTLADYFGVRKSDLIEEEPHRRRPSAPLNPHPWSEPLVNAYAAAPRPRQEAVCTVLDIPHLVPYAQVEPTVTMTVFSYPAAAGVPLYATDDYEHLEFPQSQVPPGASFGIRIQGDSMLPTIRDGAIVFVRKQPDLQNGQIGIFMLGEDAVCKRFYRTKTGCSLSSDNPAYGPIEVDAGTEGFYVAGKVLGYS